MTDMSPLKVAAAHVAPVLLDADRTIDKVCDVIGEAASNGARLVAFPETFVPAFPVWSALRSPIFNHDLFRRLVANSISVEGPELAQVSATAREHAVVVSLGFNERTPASMGCLFNSNVLIDTGGTIINHRRKLMPTFYEKLTWSPGDGAGLEVCPTSCGRVGILICGENTNPLARYTLIAQGEQLHIATFPPIWPTHPPDGSGKYDLAQAIRFRASAHSFEAKAFNLVVSGFMDREMFQFLASLGSDAGAILEQSPRGVSLVTGPSGMPVSEELCDEEGILYAEIQLDDCVEPKQFHDVSGGYNRFDVFELTVDRRRHVPIRFAPDEAETQLRSSEEKDAQ